MLDDISALEARQITRYRRGLIENRTMKKIWRKIRSACKKGNTSVCVKISEQQKDVLISRFYEVVSSDKPGFSEIRW